MKAWKHLIFAAAFLFIGGLFFVNAQDLIILRDGNTIEAKVMEITPSEVKYRRFDNLNGPTIVIPKNSVLSIRYENGVVDVIVAASGRQSGNTDSSMMDPNTTIFGISIDPSGFLVYGPSLSVEMTSGNLNAQVNIRFPSIGMLSDIGGDGFAIGVGMGVNYFHHTRIGGFYIGLMTDINYGEYKVTEYDKWGYKYEKDEVYLGVATAMNIGFKFVFSTGLYIRTGANLGVHGAMPTGGPYFLIRPDISFGYNF